MERKGTRIFCKIFSRLYFTNSGIHQEFFKEKSTKTIPNFDKVFSFLYSSEPSIYLSNAPENETYQFLKSIEVTLNGLLYQKCNTFNKNDSNYPIFYNKFTQNIIDIKSLIPSLKNIYEC